MFALMYFYNLVLYWSTSNTYYNYKISWLNLILTILSVLFPKISKAKILLSSDSLSKEVGFGNPNSQKHIVEKLKYNSNKDSLHKTLNNKISNTHFLSDTNKMAKNNPSELTPQLKSEKHPVSLNQCLVFLESIFSIKNIKKNKK